MSTNRKNDDNAVISNRIVPKAHERRNMINIGSNLNTQTLKIIVDKINETIEQINMIVDKRNVPYWRIDLQDTSATGVDKTRVVLRSESSDRRAIDDIKLEYEESQENTFLVELFVNNNGYVEIGCPREIDNGDEQFSGFVLIDFECLQCALIDIFLDSAMFNSYSFLKLMKPSEKKSFNTTKVKFLKKRYNSFINTVSNVYKFNKDQYDYLSMAFFARKSTEAIDILSFIELWDDLIANDFPNEIHKEPSVEEQFLYLTDIEQYTSRVLNECKTKPQGAWWLLRINRTPTDPREKRWLQAAMGGTAIGTERIIPLGDLAKILELVQKRYITAFKFIIQKF